jgi:signal recognition particle subunit SRP54
MFDIVSRGFDAARLKLKGQARLTEEVLKPALREVRASLLEADVGLPIIKEFLERVKDASLGDIVPVRAPTGEMVNLTPQDHFIKSCYDQLVELMGADEPPMFTGGRPTVIMMVGLQGSGKTTTSGKLAYRLKEDGHKPMLVAADIYRPAAVDQLMVLGRRLDVPVFAIKGMNPVDLAKMAVKQARSVGRDVVIIDTAGRLAIDNTLMEELERMRDAVNPHEVLFVCDAMTGQDAVATAAEFDRRLDFTGFVLTKMDGDARGGAALSIRHVTGKPVKFLGMGEELDRLEPFRAEGLAQRILGFGDVVGLMTEMERKVDVQSAEADAAKMLEGKFTYDDFMRQMRMIRKLGPLREIMSRLPGMSGMMKQIPAEALDDRQLDRTLAIIQSMTKQERRDPDVMNPSRLRRIAIGCGRSFEEVSELHSRFLQARQMMKAMGGMMGGAAGLGANPMEAMSRMQDMMSGGGMPGMPGADGGRPRRERPQVSAADRIAKKKKRKERRKSQRKGR